MSPQNFAPEDFSNIKKVDVRLGWSRSSSPSRTNQAPPGQRDAEHDERSCYSGPSSSSHFSESNASGSPRAPVALTQQQNAQGQLNISENHRRGRLRRVRHARGATLASSTQYPLNENSSQMTAPLDLLPTIPWPNDFTVSSIISDNYGDVAPANQNGGLPPDLSWNQLPKNEVVSDLRSTSWELADDFNSGGLKRLRPVSVGAR